MRARIVAYLLLAVAVTGCGGTVSQEYTSPEGKFRALFPGRPNLSEQTVSTPIGPIVLKIASSSDWSRTERFVSYADYPVGLIHTGNRDSMLDDACQGMATEARLVILSKMPITIKGHPGREVSFEAQPGHPAGKISGRARVYLVGARLYRVFMDGPSGTMTPEKIDGFLDSFALVDQDPQPTVVASGPPSKLVRHPAPPRGADRSPLGFYAIPEPATEPIVADPSPPESEGGDRPGDSLPHDLDADSEGRASTDGARIRGFTWIDGDMDVVSGAGGRGKSDGTPDHHFRLSVELPPNTIVEALVITSTGSHRWVTQPSDRDGPIAISQNGRPVARTYAAQVGAYSGPQDFDLYVNTVDGDGPGASFDVQLVLSVDGKPITLNSRCRRPG